MLRKHMDLMRAVEVEIKGIATEGVDRNDDLPKLADRLVSAILSFLTHRSNARRVKILFQYFPSRRKISSLYLIEFLVLTGSPLIYRLNL